MGFFSDIILRVRTVTGWVTKGSDLENYEVDDNFIFIADELIARDVQGVYAVWSAGSVTAGEKRIYDDKLWLCLATNSVAPVESSIWTRISIGNTSHPINEDAYLDLYGANEISAATLKAMSLGETIFSYDISITSAQLLAANATPITLVAAPGASKLLVPFASPFMSATFVTTAYDTNMTLEIYVDTSSESLFTLTNGLNFTQNLSKQFAVDSPTGATDDQLEANKALMIRVASGEALNGAGTIVIKGFYKIFDV